MLINRIFLPAGLLLFLMLISNVPSVQKYALLALNVRLNTDNNKVTKYNLMLSPGTMIIIYKIFFIIFNLIPADIFGGLFTKVLGNNSIFNTVNETESLFGNSFATFLFLELVCIIIWAFNTYYAIELKNRYLKCGQITEKVVKKTLKDFKT